MTEQASRVDRLLDAIELVKADRREEAAKLLRELIQEDNDSEEAWLWMSVAVDSLDQSIICLDHVLRLNPNNVHAAGALYRLQETTMAQESQRARLRFYRDLSLVMMWLVIFFLMLGGLITFVQLQGSGT
jgi:tetratricopeptide (TPR) repeat protein